MTRVGRLLVAPLALGALSGCTGQPPPPTCTSSGETRGSVVTFATFAKRVSANAVEGLDVDGVISDGSDDESCNKVDFTSPDGITGVDNQIATLLPLVEEMVGTGNIDALLEAAITNGQLLILMAVRGMDDAANDECVDVAFGAGTGTPYLDTGGKYVSNQTFAWNLGQNPVSVLYRGRIDGGVLTAGPGDVTIPVQILDAKFNLTLHSTHVRMKLTRDPLTKGMTLEGLVGGGVEVEKLGAAIKTLNIQQSVKGAVVPLIASKADLGRDAEGNCQQISTALRFRTTAAFVMGE
jgi:hypothetical protein